MVWEVVPYPSHVCQAVLHKEKWLVQMALPHEHVRLVHQDTTTIVCQHLSTGKGRWDDIRRPGGDQECKYTLAVLVRDQELGIVDVESEILKKLTDIKIFIVGFKDGDHPDMDIGGLVVLKMP